ncbi:MAG TPA: hypothetical protein VKQ72_09020 [Aggregatilineales bacterium]|nr:hypothetical protein [Aggregatilineales bacterium]
MRKSFIFVSLCLFLAACQGASTPVPVDPKAAARKYLDGQNKQSVQITNVVSGNTKAIKGADGLWCVETDEKNADGVTTLLTVFSKAGAVTVTPMDSEYEWDLNGCPRQ